MKLVSGCLILTVLLMSGCVTPMGITYTTTPLQERKFQNLGVAEGSSMSWSLLGLWAMGKPDIDGAIAQALGEKEGDALINVRWYERTYYFFLFSLHELVVTGDAIRFVPDFSTVGSSLE